MASISFNAHHLRKPEVKYELKIRGLSTDGKADELRKRLKTAFKNNTPVNLDVISALDPDTELMDSHDKLKELKDVVEDYEGDKGDFQRISARLLHLYQRVDRVCVDDEDGVLDEDQQKSKEEIRSKTNDLIGALKKRSEDVSTNSDSSAPPTATEETSVGHASAPSTGITLGTSQPTEIQQPLRSTDKTTRPTSSIPRPTTANTDPTSAHQHSPSPVVPVGNFDSKAIPIYKWGLQFSNGPGQSVGAFLQRVEELQRARGISTTQLFQSAVDLFTGSALVWYRSTVGRISSWDELRKEMKVVFQTPDYDDMLTQEIMSRRQGDREPVDLYIASMEGLYSRLSVPATENDRLKQMLKNLNRYLQEKLCMFTIPTIEELRQLGRKAELGRMRASNVNTPAKACTVLEPDLAYQTSESSKHNVSKVAYVNTPKPIIPKLKCWNCDEDGHRFTKCSKPRKVFCFRCGTKDVKKVDCPKCHPKNS